MVLTLSKQLDTQRDADSVEAVRSGVRARFEPHIQGLRALAVASVVLYHLWPLRLPGGYVGVDIFFVISGYLICGHLLREVETTGAIRLVDFWARRIRRLLPAALTVLACATVFVVLAIPAIDWEQNLHEIRAAALYAENWQLVGTSIDYLASENAPSLVQHFWSLSVEEQFYFSQPLLLLGAVRLFRTRRAFVPVLTAVVVLSLPYSIYLTASQPGAAYFSTGTRAWEFALGGLAAVAAGRIAWPPAMRAVLGWLGLALIAAALMLYSPTTPFPGIAAAVPVIGTALAMVFAGSTSPIGPGRLLGAAPLKVVGDWSYAIYLWHWPLIVAVPVLLNRPAGWKVKLTMLLVTVVLAALTKRLVEDRWRQRRSPGRPWRTYAATFVAMTLIAGTTTAAAHWRAAETTAQAGRAQAAITATSERCLGISAVVNECDRPYAVTSAVIPAVAADDVPWNLGVAASQSCSGESNVSAPRVHACVFNDPPSPTRTVALIGDSHADHFIDALNAYATEHNWRFLTYTREGCGAVVSGREADARCRTWSADLEKELAARDDIGVVVVANYASAEKWTVSDAVAEWRGLEAAGRVVVPIVDVPGMPEGTTAPKCVASHMREYDPCSTELPPTSKTVAAARQLNIRTVSVNDLLCAGGRCHAVIGGEIVYLDAAHLTLHFSYSLRNVLGSRISAAVKQQE